MGYTSTLPGGWGGGSGGSGGSGSGGSGGFTWNLGIPTGFQWPTKPSGQQDPQPLTAEPTAQDFSNRLAYGNPIPIFRGAGKLTGRYVRADTIIHSDGGRWFGSAAIVFFRNAFQRPATLLRLWADDRLIYDVTSITPLWENEFFKMRIYDGVDNVVDPWIAEKDGDTASAMAGYGGIVFEFLRLEKFNLTYPLFRAEWSDDTEVEQIDEDLTPAGDVGDLHKLNGLYDYINNRIYQVYIDNYGTSEASLVVGIVDLNTGVEIGRAAITGLPEQPLSSPKALFNLPVPLPGSDHLIGRTYDGYAVVNAITGKVVCEGFTGLGFHIDWLCAQQYFGTNGVRYIAAGTQFDGSNYRLAIAVIDLDAGTIEFPTDAGLVNVSSDANLVVCTGISETNLTTFYCAADGGIYGIAYSATGYTATLISDFASLSIATGIAYDNRDGGIVLSYWDTGDTFKYFVAKIGNGGAEEWNVEVSPGDYVDDGHTFNNTFFVQQYAERGARLLPGFAVLLNSLGPAKLLDLSSGSASSLFSYAADSYSVIYDQLSRAIYDWQDSEFWVKHYVDVTSNLIPISEILTDFACYGDRFQPSDLTFIGLEDQYARGFIFKDNAELGQAINSVCQVYGISIVESDGGIKFVRNGRGAYLDISQALTAADLVEEKGEQISTVKSHRTYENDVASSVEVQFIDYTKDFDQGSANHKRPKGVFNNANGRPRIYSLPLTLDIVTAKEKAIDLLYSENSAQTAHSIAVPPGFAYIEPADILRIPTATGTSVVIVKTATMREDHSQALDVWEFLQDDETSFDAFSGTPEEITDDSLGLTQYIHLDLPLRAPSHDLSGEGLVQYHVLSGRGQPHWAGGSAYRSKSGANFAEISRYSQTYPTVAVALNSIGAPAVLFSTDYDNELTIRVMAGDEVEIASSTYLDVMNGANLAAYGAPGRWELIAWITAEENADGSFTLSGLQRGLYNSETYVDDHQSGDLVVPLTTKNLLRLPYATTDLNLDYFFRAYGSSDFQLGVINARRITGEAERCPAPCQLAGEVVGTSVLLSWIRRSRLGGIWGNNGSSVPLGEASELYDVEIMDGVAIKRTFSNVPLPNISYLESALFEDWGEMPSEITFRVYQISALTGRGHRAEATISIIPVPISGGGSLGGSGNFGQGFKKWLYNVDGPGIAYPSAALTIDSLVRELDENGDPVDAFMAIALTIFCPRAPLTADGLPVLEAVTANGEGLTIEVQQGEPVEGTLSAIVTLDHTPTEPFTLYVGCSQPIAYVLAGFWLFRNYADQHAVDTGGATIEPNDSISATVTVPANGFVLAALTSKSTAPEPPASSFVAIVDPEPGDTEVQIIGERSGVAKFQGLYRGIHAGSHTVEAEFFPGTYATLAVASFTFEF